MPTSQTLRISVLNPHGRFDESTIHLQSGSRCSVLLSHESVSQPSMSIVYVQEMIYNRRTFHRRAIQCYDAQTGNLPFVDIQDGEFSRNQSWLRFSRRFLQLSSSLPTSPRHLPRVIVLTDAEVNIMNRWGDLEVASYSALEDPSYAIFIMGIKSGERFFWELVGDSFVDASSGEVFWRRGWVPRGNTKRHLLLLLRHGDKVPSVMLPQKKFLRVFRRTGISMRIDGGKVDYQRTTPTNIDLWDSPLKMEPFDEEFSKAASKK